MSLASSAAMKTRTALTSSQIEFEYSKIEDKLEMATDKYTQLGALLSKYEGYLSQCNTQIPITAMNIASIMQTMKQQPQSKQNSDLASQLSLLNTKYFTMKNAYMQLAPKVIYLKTQTEKAHYEEQELTKQIKAMETRKKLADQGNKTAEEFEKGAIERMSFKA